MFTVYCYVECLYYDPRSSAKSRYFENIIFLQSDEQVKLNSYNSVHETTQPDVWLVVVIKKTKIFLIDPITIGNIERSAANPDKGVINCNPPGGICRVQISQSIWTILYTSYQHYCQLYYRIYS